MTPAGLLAGLRARGATIAADGDRLAVELPERLQTMRVLSALAEHKSALLTLLADEAGSAEASARSERDENGLPVDRFTKIDNPALLDDTDRRALAAFEQMRIERERRGERW